MSIVGDVMGLLGKVAGLTTNVTVLTGQTNERARDLRGLDRRQARTDAKVDFLSTCIFRGDGSGGPRPPQLPG